ncbi:allophanate hydrolase [Cryobacterium melibiosiphilum]|uniref:Allophanate hydrolase n=1 Tax=Cryobacterium melibiosiphilum TaxID=995039 RepID=A0A3A5MNA8_9MICO|nr:allophanate hydrolase [Cryobacterium melibiosiphilum]RJT90465.1 allophanate hydrolase [Cryobacterium melibiosiphilum]
MTAHLVTDRVRAAYDVIDAVDRPEVWITLENRDAVFAQAAVLDERMRRGSATEIPLAGLLVAVKDNMDVAGLPTAAALPSFVFSPTVSSPAVARLQAAGAIVLGKTNMDQFATGLVGTRSPYGAVRHATRPEYISGGSSSGSAVAVALGIVDIALGTDTAGSGRVPAALHGLVGIKPTLGLIPTIGVVPACRSYDSVTVFAQDLGLAQRALAVIVGPDRADPSSRSWPSTTRLAPRGITRIGIPAPADLKLLSADAQAAFTAAVDSVVQRGMQTVTVDLAPFLRAAVLLYDGALVAERYEAAGASVAAGEPGLDPVVAQIVRAAGTIPAHRLVEDRALLDTLRTQALRVFDDYQGVKSGIDALVLPTTTEHPTLAAVAADPVAINARMGTFTNFVNLFDLSAIAVPAGTADGSPFGVSFIAPAFADQVIIDIAAKFLGQDSRPALLPTDTLDLVVFGAHLRGQPLNWQLTDLGARLAGDVRTATAYRMVRLPGEPARPGVSPVGSGGTALVGERWTLTKSALADFLTCLPPGMSIGPIQLEDGEQVLGFQCSNSDGAEDISAYGGWVRYLAEGDHTDPAVWPPAG